MRDNVSTTTKAPNRRCEHCGRPIRGRREDSAYCSPAHAQAAKRARRLAREAGSQHGSEAGSRPGQEGVTDRDSVEGSLRALSATQAHAGFADVSTDVPASTELLSRWRFRDPETHSVQMLAGLWPGQATFWKLAHEHDRLIGLKGRQVGLTTVVLAVVAEHFLTTPNAQVNVLSREEGSALDLLERVRFGMSGLGAALERETFSVLETGTDTDDMRRVEAFTSARDATRGRTASLVLLDEWAAMMDPARVLRAVEPTSPRIIILFTSAGPDDPTSDFYRQSKAEQTGFRSVFIGADQRPDRDAEWWAAKEATTDSLTLAREYPRTDEEALQAGGFHVFQTADLATVDQYTAGRSEPQGGVGYVIGIDLASKRGGDKSAYVVLEALSEDFAPARWNVAEYVEFTGTDYAVQGAAIRSLYERFNGATLAIEETGVGAGVIDNLDVPEDRIERMQTTQVSKQRRLGRLEVAVRTRALVYEPADFPELHQAMLGAVWGEHTPDAVIALSFAPAVAEEGRAVATAKRARRGRLMKDRRGGVIRWGGTPRELTGRDLMDAHPRSRKAR